MSAGDQITPFSSGNTHALTGEETAQEPKLRKGLLSPVDRVSETLYGLIMALTYTCTFKIVVADKTQVSEMLWSAIGCNIAWGLVDGIMYVLTANSEKGHSIVVLRFIKKTKNQDKAREIISDELPSLIASAIKPDDLENIRLQLLKIPEPPRKITSTLIDMLTALGIFIYVFLSTLPVVIPFLFVADDRRALRISNGIAIFMMFICGWILGQYAGGKPWITGFVMSLIGIILVAIAILLGG
jgi:VIT1/CCC1 family predicted Fe2+/Mn2+ transporter